MSYWLIVRDEKTIKPALTQANALLATMNSSQNETDHALQGIWVDAATALNPPTQLTTLDIAGEKVELNMHEALGVGGLWLLCRIEPESRSSGLSYDQALTGLLNFMETQKPQYSAPTLPVLCQNSHSAKQPLKVDELTQLELASDQQVSLAWYKHSA